MADREGLEFQGKEIFGSYLWLAGLNRAFEIDRLPEVVVRDRRPTDQTFQVAEPRPDAVFGVVEAVLSSDHCERPEYALGLFEISYAVFYHQASHPAVCEPVQI